MVKTNLINFSLPSRVPCADLLQHNQRFRPNYLFLNSHIVARLIEIINTRKMIIMGTRCHTITTTHIWLYPRFPRNKRYWSYDAVSLTHLPPDKMADIVQTTFSNAFLWTKVWIFWFGFSLKFVHKDLIDSIGSGNGLAPNRRQAINWTNSDLGVGLLKFRSSISP